MLILAWLASRILIFGDSAHIYDKRDKMHVWRVKNPVPHTTTYKAIMASESP